MSDAQRAPLAESEGEAPINPYSLLDAVNASSEAGQTSWLIFIAVMAYATIAVAGVTHKDLLLGRDIPLPILQVPISLTRFFLFAPIVLVLVHTGVVTHLVMLSKKALELDGALRMVEATDQRTHPLRLELHSFFFVQGIAGPERGHLLNGLLHGLSWLTVVALPVLLLLYIQVAFLPYHDAGITWAHRVALLADIALLGLVGVFLTRPDKSFVMALWGAGLSHPITLLSTIAIFCAVGFFAFFVATVPGERIDRLLGDVAPAARRPQAWTSEASAAGFSFPFFGVTRDGRLFGIFERNLNVTDYDLVVDKDVTPGEPTLNLRHRDLRFARLDRTDLHQADFTGANLDGASLSGADLRSVLLRCTDLNALVLTGDRKTAGCASAHGANFDKARLSDAVLEGLDLSGSRFEEADLAAANLDHADLTGADLYASHLERAELTGGIAMVGVNLATAALQGADLTGAKLLGADLTGAAMQGAILDFADLSGASLRDGDLEGASLYQAKLALADLSGASLRAASLREAWIWSAQPPSKARVELADLGALNMAAPQAAETGAIEAALKVVREPQLANRVREALAPLLAQPVAKSSADWSDLMRANRDEPAEAGTPPSPWTAPAVASFQPGAGVSAEPTGATSPAAPPTAAPAPRMREPQVRLSRHLADLACRPRWSNGAVATGLVKRALSPAFNGDVKVFYDGLRQSDCLAARTMPARIFSRLVNTVDQARAR